MNIMSQLQNRESASLLRSESGNVLEVSRRIMSGHRNEFNFLRQLQDRAKQLKFQVHCSPADVRVDLISQFDNINPDGSDKISRLGGRAIATLLRLQQAATSNTRIAMILGEPVLNNKINGWQAVEMPVVKSDYPLSEERTEITHRIDEILETKGRQWVDVVPALQIVEFVADPQTAEAILKFVHINTEGIEETEVYEATVRFRKPILV